MRAIAEEMGVVLIRSAFSANIKERRDCSTALFDERGRMIVQAEHIPVHLGAMPDAVAAVIRRNPGIDDVCARYGRDRVVAAMDELYAYSERLVRAGIAAMPDGRYEAADFLDDGTKIQVALSIDGESIELDFAGTDAQQRDGNLNCPLAVTRSAAYFVVRCLAAPDVPASGGAFAPVAVRAPEGSLVNARPPAAVAGGNVETSSRIVDVAFAAFGQAIPVPAQGQGTMNNVTLGNDRFTYYETIGGGQGACPDADGPSGVHVTMSNTLTTPVEALELSYPLRVERYGLRLGSGGAGRHRGGDGVLRELRVLEP